MTADLLGAVHPGEERGLACGGLRQSRQAEAGVQAQRDAAAFQGTWKRLRKRMVEIVQPRLTARIAPFIRFPDSQPIDEQQKNMMRGGHTQYIFFKRVPG